MNVTPEFKVVVKGVFTYFPTLHHLYSSFMTSRMLDDILKFIRTSHKWGNSPLGRRLGLHRKEKLYINDSTIELDENLSNWVQLSTSGDCPPVRSGHSSVVVDNYMYVFGGYNAGICHHDIYAFDLLRHHWFKLSTHSKNIPEGRASHACCVSTDKTCLYLFGGSGPQWGQTNMGKLLKFNIIRKEWSVIDHRGLSPPPGYGQSLCAINGKLYLFGGTSGHVYVNDLYIFDETTEVWKKAETSGQKPSPRYKHQAAVVNSKMYIVGGGLYDPPHGPIDTYVLDIETLMWTELQCNGEIPRSRIAHTICQEPRNPHCLIMFGGRDALGLRRNEVSKLNLKTGEWTILKEERNQPEPCDFHSAVIFQDDLYVFGGSNGKERNNDVYRRSWMYHPPTLLVLAMKALQQNITQVPCDQWEKLPIELQVGVQAINPHVQSQENLSWLDMSCSNCALIQTSHSN